MKHQHLFCFKFVPLCIESSSLMNKIYLFVFVLFYISGIYAFPKAPAVEVRAVWLTTNYGLDWPHNKTNEAAQKKELINILDNLKRHNFNTILFQVRGRGEVLYQSQIEPMSSLIVSDKYGNPSFDPLEFVIDEAHKRGLSCHAWVVTYPLGGDKHVKSLGSKSIIKKNPSIVKKFHNEWFLDPGVPATDDYLLSIVKEIVTKYDIDGIHFDYIRYPDNKGLFPDTDTYKRYGHGKDKAEWRRDNITRFVTKTYDWVKQNKPWVQVSSSPLGRYRALGNNGHGWTAFETVYQDAAKWMQTGKHDAIYPMMYYKENLFYPFVDDWMKNCNDRILVPGLAPYQMVEMGWSRKDILNQIDYTRSKEVQGQSYFRAQNVLSNTKGILDSLSNYYKNPAKLPAMKWLNDTAPSEPIDLRAEISDLNIFQLTWIKPDSGDRITYNVYRSEKDSLSTQDGDLILATGLRNNIFEYIPEEKDKAYYYYITASDAFNNESAICFPAFFYHSDTVK